MRKWIITIILLLALAAIPVQALAADEDLSVEVVIPFTFENNVPGTVTIELDEGSPTKIGPELPDPVYADDYSGGTFTFTFTQVGEYLYKVRQTETQENVTLDPRHYLVGISVVYKFDVAGKITGMEYDIEFSQGDAPTNAKVGAINFKNVPQYARLTIKKVAKSSSTGSDLTSVYYGDEFLYEITVENVGRSPATNVTITDTLPIQDPPLIVTNPIDGTLGNDGQTITWTLDSISPGDKRTVRFYVRVPAVDKSMVVNKQNTWINTAIAEYSGASADSLARSSTDTVTATVSAPYPAVIVEKWQSLNGAPRTQNVIDVKPGDKITYYITLTNISPAAAADVEIWDEIPVGTSAAPLQPDTSTITREGKLHEDSDGIQWYVGRLEAGVEDFELEFTVRVPSVSKETHWYNTADGSYNEAKAISTLAWTQSGKYKLLSNTVEARYIPPRDSGSSGSPSTGDNARLGMWIAISAASVVGLAVVLVPWRKKKK